MTVHSLHPHAAPPAEIRAIVISDKLVRIEVDPATAEHFAAGLRLVCELDARDAGQRPNWRAEVDELEKVAQLARMYNALGRVDAALRTGLPDDATVVIPIGALS